jgi:glycerophosphoryl diester phosphodiesterase
MDCTKRQANLHPGGNVEPTLGHPQPMLLLSAHPAAVLAALLAVFGLFSSVPAMSATPPPAASTTNSSNLAASTPATGTNAGRTALATKPVRAPIAPAIRPLVIAHRGASGYLPEHTLEAKALAYAQGADYLEQDVVISKDGVPVVAHDLTLEDTSNVRDIFPERVRADGHWYLIDFTWEELRTLTLHERTAEGGTPARAGRFAASGVSFRLHTLDEELAFIRGLNATLGKHQGREVGVYTEVKSPAWHREQGVDAAPIVLAALARHGYTKATDLAYVQCFDFAELRRIRQGLRSELKLVQLIGENSWGEATTDYTYLLTPAGLREVATVADGIGPWGPQVLTFAPGKAPAPTGLVEAAHAEGLVVHPYTLRADDLPPGVADLPTLVKALQAAGIDGAFTDFPDQLRAALK